MARYRKAVSSALWVQLALVFCYVLKFTMLVVITYRKIYSSYEVVIDGITIISMYFKSTLNPLWLFYNNLFQECYNLIMNK